MERAKYLLNKFMFPSKHREISGNVELQTAVGELFIPVDFSVAQIESDVFLQGNDPNADFIAPCTPIPNEFVNVEIVNDPSKPHQIHISWAVNSYRTLVWKASGFVE